MTAAVEHIGTWRNVEHSGERNDLSLSNALRKVKGVRHLDLDGYQYDPKSQTFEILFEATSSMGDKDTTMTRALAKQAGAFVFLIQHHWHDEDNELPIYLTLWHPNGKIDRDFLKYKCEWSDFIDYCQQIHEFFLEERK